MGGDRVEGHAEEGELSATITDLVCTCNGMPNQYEGKVNGKPFYFRARWEAWRLHVNSDTAGGGYEGTVIASGEADGGGWWEDDEAEAFLRARIEECAERGLL